MNKKKILIPIVVIGLVGLGVGGYYVYKEVTRPAIIRATFVTDFKDPRKLVGYSDNVFVGRVIEQTGVIERAGTPETQFKVEVLENIKGKLEGTVIVNQQGGYDRETGRLYLMEGDTLLQPGKMYLFATGYDKEYNFHTLVPVFGDIPIENITKRAELVKKFKQAHAEEIPFIRNGKRL
ncbi:MAG: hypothetical protein C0P72_010255 [Clostridia bacterium]